GLGHGGERRGHQELPRVGGLRRPLHRADAGSGADRAGLRLPDRQGPGRPRADLQLLAGLLPLRPAPSARPTSRKRERRALVSVVVRVPSATTSRKRQRRTFRNEPEASATDFSERAGSVSDGLFGTSRKRQRQTLPPSLTPPARRPRFT